MKRYPKSFSTPRKIGCWIQKELYNLASKKCVSEVFMKRYPIGFEVSGPLAMFARPDTGSEPCSYPIATPSACRGMIESICWIPGVDVDIVAIGSCEMPRWADFSYSSASPIRKSSLLTDGNAVQIKATVLENVRFQVLATLSKSERACNPKHQNINNAHSFQVQFLRRLRRGQFFHPVCLGWKEFQAEYVGPIRSKIATNFNTVIPSMLMQCFNKMGELQVSRKLNAEIKSGILQVTSDEVSLNENGQLAFVDPSLNQSDFYEK